MTQSKQTLSDFSEWQEFTEAATPIPSKHLNRALSEYPSIPRQSSRQTLASHKKLPPGTTSPLRQDSFKPSKKVGVLTANSYRQNGISEKKLRQLRGANAEDSLDLHHKTQTEAFGLLETFINDSLERRYRVVQIIHGKGWHSENLTPILRPLTLGYLQNSPAILAFVMAADEGSVLILLKNISGH